MSKILNVFAFLVSLLGPLSTQAATPVVDANVAGHTFEWHWEEGAFKGAAFSVSFLNDGQLHWKGISGGVVGKSDTEKTYRAILASSNVRVITWQEKSGYTVTVVLNHADGRCTGVVSNGSEWYVLSGYFIQVS